MSIAVCVAAAFLSAASATASSKPWVDYEYLQLPPGVTADQLRDPDPGLLSRLEAIEEAALSRSAGAERVLFFVDEEGRPVTPDLDRARSSENTDSGELTFTFDSPDHPWSADQVAELEELVALMYPTAIDVYGPPAFTITVEIRLRPDGGASYSSYFNRIYLGSVDDDQLCHEILHAFRDDIIIGLKTFEEGMVRAAEVEVFNRLTDLDHWDEHHSYSYDRFFDVLDRPEVGSVGGWSWSEAGLALLRYQLSGYAWAKPLLESSEFFVRFNEALLDAALADPTVTDDEAQLVEIAADAQPVVEGRSLARWYRGCGVFDTTPPLGPVIYQRLNQYTVDVFYRHETGIEEVLSDQPVSWAVKDHAGAVLDRGETVTNSYGVGSFNPGLGGYQGRLSVCVSAEIDGHTVIDCGIRPTGGRGVFGVIAGHDAGTVTVRDLEGRVPPQTVPVVNGAFSVPSLRDLAGRFVADFEPVAGWAMTKRFTKDASDYVLVIGDELRAPRQSGGRRRP